jgi:flagellin
MPLYINTNTSSLNAQRQLMSSGQALDKAMTRLSSGMRINSAADDAAGLAISNRQTSQIRGLNQAVRNANDGISMIQTAEGAISETTNILQRMRELAVQSSNGIYDDKDRATMDAEVQQLVQELDRIAKSTSFNGKNILDGSVGKMDLQVGADANQTIRMSIQAVDAKTLGMGSTSVDLLGGASDLASLTGDLELKENDILINGQSILRGTDTWDGAGADDTVQDLLNHINKNVNGVTASTYAQATATSAGDGILTKDQFVTVTLTNLDGTTSAIGVGGETNSLQELVDKMNSASGGKFSVSLDDNGRVAISAENVASIGITSTGTTNADAISALGVGIADTFNASITLKADNGDPVTVTRGSTGTLEQLANFGFRENDVAGVIEGHAVNTTALAVGDLKINGVNVGASETGGLQDKIKAINAVSDQTGVTAKAFTSVSLDFGGVALSGLAGGMISMNGVDVNIPVGAPTTKLSDVAAAFNAKTDATGITASISGTRIILEGNVSQIAFGTGVGGTPAAPEAALTDATNTALFAVAGSESTALAIDGAVPANSVASGGIQLISNNGSPISVDVKDAAAEAKTGLIDSNVMGGGAFGTAIANISISSQQGAQKALGVIDNALETVNDIRSQLGAVNNRLDFTVSNLSNVVENTQAARARITDADFAAETAALSRAQVLQQASQAMLAQANARPQQVLSLLQ